MDDLCACFLLLKVKSCFVLKCNTTDLLANIYMVIHIYHRNIFKNGQTIFSSSPTQNTQIVISVFEYWCLKQLSSYPMIIHIQYWVSLGSQMAWVFKGLVCCWEARHFYPQWHLTIRGQELGLPTFCQLDIGKNVGFRTHSMLGAINSICLTIMMMTITTITTTRDT